MTKGNIHFAAIYSTFRACLVTVAANSDFDDFRVLFYHPDHLVIGFHAFQGPILFKMVFVAKNDTRARIPQFGATFQLEDGFLTVRVRSDLSQLLDGF